MKNQFDKFSSYELSMIQSFARNALVTTRQSDRHSALIEATLSMINVKGYVLHDAPKDLEVLLRKKFSTHNVFTINGDSSLDVIEYILKCIYELDVVIIKDESKVVAFEPPHNKCPVVEFHKKPWVM